MKKRIILTVFMIFVLMSLASPEWRVGFTFLRTAEDVNASATAVNQTDFVSGNEPISFPGYSSVVAITITFTRVAGSASNIDFEFQVSNDDGTSFSTAAYVTISAPTNSDADSNVVRHTELVNIHGLSHIRLYQIVNNDGANNVTACNATLSFNID